MYKNETEILLKSNVYLIYSNLFLNREQKMGTNNLEKLKHITEHLVDRDFELKKKVFVYENIIKTLIKGIWIIDNNEKTIYADELITKMLNCSLEDLQDKSVYEFISDMDKRVARKYINAGHGMLKELTFKTKDGKSIKSKIYDFENAQTLQNDGIKFLVVDNEKVS